MYVQFLHENIQLLYTNAQFCLVNLKLHKTDFLSTDKVYDIVDKCEVCGYEMRTLMMI